jgi:hypothetical protein
MTRHCANPACIEPLVKRANEAPRRFERRQYCGHDCSNSCASPERRAKQAAAVAASNARRQQPPPPAWWGQVAELRARGKTLGVIMRITGRPKGSVNYAMNRVQA